MQGWLSNNSYSWTFPWQRKRAIGVRAVGVSRRGSMTSTCMRPLKRQLLVMVQTVGKEGVICSHCHLHRFNDTFKLLNTLKYLLQTGQTSVICLCLPDLYDPF